MLSSHTHTHTPTDEDPAKNLKPQAVGQICPRQRAGSQFKEGDHTQQWELDGRLWNRRELP